MKNKFLVWFLVLVGGLVLGYVVYTLIPRPKPESVNMDNRADWQPGRSFFSLAEELGLSQSQQNDFQNMEVEYRQKLSRINNALMDINQEIVEQLRLEQPDTAYLNVLTEKTGRLHVQLKQSTIDHFMNLRSVCTPEQALRLSGVLEQVGPMQRGMRRGDGRGQRRGWQNRKNQ